MGKSRTNEESTPPLVPPAEGAAPPATPAVAASHRDTAPGHKDFVDETPTMSVTCDHDGFSPSAGAAFKNGSHEYSHEIAAALVSAGIGRVSKKERATLEANGLLKPPTEETKE